MRPHKNVGPHIGSKLFDTRIDIFDILGAFFLLYSVDLKDKNFVNMQGIDPYPAKHNKNTRCKQLGPDETPGDQASHPDPSCLTLREYFHQL